MDIVKQEIALFCTESVQTMFYIPCHPYVPRIIFSAKVLKTFQRALDLVLFRPRASAPRAKLTFNCLSLPRDPLTASCAPPTANFQTPHKSRPTFNYFRSPDSAAACKRSFCFFTQLFFTQCQNSNSKQLT